MPYGQVETRSQRAVEIAIHWVPRVEEGLFRGSVLIYAVWSVLNLLTAGPGERGQAIALALVRIPLVVLTSAAVFSISHTGEGWWKALPTRFIAALYLQYLWLTARPLEAVEIHQINNELVRAIEQGSTREAAVARL